MPDALSYRRPSRNVVTKVALGLLLLGLVARASTGRKTAPLIPADCAKPSFALSATTVRQGKSVAYTIAGPAGRKFVVAVDTATFEPDPKGGYLAVPLPGHEQDYDVASDATPMPAACRRSGRFTLPPVVGDHAVTLFELTPDGTLFVKQETVTVT